jgi:hypothetical protein
MSTHPSGKILALYLAVAVFVLSFPAQSWAMLVPVENRTARSADLVKLRTALESSVVRQRLMDYGLSSEEATARLNTLTDKELHQFAAHLDAAQAGGSLAGDVIFVLLVVLLVIVILELTGHRVVVRR